MASSSIEPSSVLQRVQTQTTQADLESGVAAVPVAAGTQSTTVQSSDVGSVGFTPSRFSLETYGLRIPNNIGDLAAEVGLSELLAEFLERDNKGLKGIAKGVETRDALSRRLDNLEKISSLENDVATLEGNITTLEGQIDGLSAQEAETQAELDRKIPGLESELETLKQQEADLVDLVDSLASDPEQAEELAAAQAQLETVRGDIASVEGQIAALENELGAIQSDLAAAQLSLSDTQTALGETRESLDTARDLEIVLVTNLQTLSAGAELKVKEDQDLATDIAKQEFQSPFVVALQRIYQRNVEDEFIPSVITENSQSAREEQLLATFLSLSGIVPQIRDIINQEYAATADLDVDPFAQATSRGSRMQLAL